MKFLLQKFNPANKVIVFTVVVFSITQGLVYGGVLLQSQLNQWLCVPQQLPLFLERPWTLFTYAFYHISIEHLFWNMLFLFFSGHIFFRLFKTKIFINTYFFSLIGGGIAFLLWGYITPEIASYNALLGASAAVIGLLFFVVTIFPSYKIYVFTFRIQLLYFLLALILFDCIDISTNIGGKIAHFGGILSGLLTGFIYKYFFLYKKKPHIVSPPTITEPQTPHLSENQKIKQHQIQKLFNKISTSGYDSLTDEEKKYLFQATKENE
jgi:transmembrane rhomboid family protein